MIKIKVFKNKYGKYIGFHSSGHALYADYGNDIVCASVSVLMINLINSIEVLTEDRFKLEIHEEGGDLKLMLNNGCSGKSLLLLDSCMLGIRSVADEYGDKYIKIITKEVE